MMFGLSFDGRIAFKTGGVLTLVMAFILIFKAYEAKTKDYRRTEMWLYLPKEQRPPKAYRAMGEFDGAVGHLSACSRCGPRWYPLACGCSPSSSR